MQKPQASEMNPSAHCRASPSGSNTCLGDAEIQFSDGPLDGLEQIRFSIWERRTGGFLNVTFPALVRRQPRAPQLRTSPSHYRHGRAGPRPYSVLEAHAEYEEELAARRVAH
jgi:hypothetical protein